MQSLLTKTIRDGHFKDTVAYMCLEVTNKNQLLQPSHIRHLNFLDNKQIFDLFYFLDLEITQEAKQCNITKANKYHVLCIQYNNGKMEKYATLEEAYVACLGNSTTPKNVCKMVTHYVCIGYKYWTCSGTKHPSTEWMLNSCAWLE